MAELLKNQFFQPSFIQDLSERILEAYPTFKKEQFLNLIYDDGWDDKALKERMSHISQSLRTTLPLSYLEALDILRDVGVNYQGFDGMVFPDFVGQFGIDFWTESLEALELFTQYSSGEFAIRHFILKDPNAAMNKMLDWSKHPNEHVRRLSSEGCRPRLPWAMALPEFKKDPALILPILNNLRADKSEYVRKSVANNLNDITKDNADIALALADKWMKKAGKETSWIVKHGLRSLVKDGNKKALELLGFNNVNIQLKELNISPHQLEIGSELTVDFALCNNDKTPANLVVDYIMHFVKANGTTAPKVFKIANITLEPNETRKLSKRHTIKPITTRKYYSGTCHVELQVNGLKLGKESFELTV
ncbi:MAG: DNA alkylation repair protein [Bacteroidota bacterium]